MCYAEGHDFKKLKEQQRKEMWFFYIHIQYMVQKLIILKDLEEVFLGYSLKGAEFKTGHMKENQSISIHYKKILVKNWIYHKNCLYLG